MAQTKVTEYFSTRKRTFGLIQPSKKLKLEVEHEAECKTSLISPSICRPRLSLPNTVKRKAKRKHVAVNTGNIKSFLDTSASKKMPKLCATPVEAFGKGLQSTNTKTPKDVINFKISTLQDKSLSSRVMPKSTNGIPQEKALSKASPISLNRETLQDQEVQSASGFKKMDSNNVNTRPLVPFDKCIEQAPLMKSLKPDLTETQAEQSNTKPINVVLGNVANFAKVKKNKQLLSEKLNNFKKALSEVQVPEKLEASVPAYQRFKSLSLVDSECSLVLPFKYKVLEEFFRATETVVSMFHNRKEVCSFVKLKQGVQQMVKRNFDRKILGQIDSVYPSAYTFHLEKGIKGGNVRLSDGQLTIAPIIASKDHLNRSQCIQMTPHVLLERRKAFHVNLILITKDYHEKFLANLHPPLQMSSDQIRRWHPKFPVDDVPDITASPLPEPVEVKISTVQDVLEKVKDVVGQRIGKALRTIAEEKPPVPVNPVAPTRISSGALKGVSQALLDKIRNKECAKVARDMLRTPESAKRIEMLSSLPEFVRILRTFFVVEKRAAIALEDAMVKIADSFHSSISPQDVEKHLKLLSQVVPKWLFFLTIPKGVFLKIDKRMDVNDIVKVIDEAIKKEKS